MLRKPPIGTNIRRSFDTRKIGESLKFPGIDPRHWVSYGTVGIVNEDGSTNVTDKRCVYIGPEGVDVDVVLEPLDMPVTCHYAGIQGGGDTTIMAPIRPGDKVLVVLPEGDPNMVPVIVAILHSAAVPVPLVQADSKPVFRNDRLLVYTKSVDIDIRTAGGAHVEVKQDGTVLLNDGTKGAARLDDDVGISLAGTAPGPAIPISTIEALAKQLLATGAFTPSGSPAAGPSISFSGKITSASGTVKAGG